MDEQDRININRSEVSYISSSWASGEYQGISKDLKTDTTKRSWVSRTFGPMQKGSLRSSIISLLSCAMGAGLLAYPSNARNSGIALCIIIITVCGMISRLSMYLLLAVSFKTDINTFPSMVEKTLGKGVKRAFEANIIVYMFGVLVCQQIIFTDFMWEACEAFGVAEDQKQLYQLVFSLGFILLNLPISMLKDVYQLRYFAQLQLAVIVYVVFAMIVYFFANFDTSVFTNEVKYFIVDQTIFASFASTFYGYIAHQMILPLKTELMNTSFKRMNKVCTRATVMTYLIYCVVMAVGYLTWYGECQTLIINNYKNLYFTVAKMAMAFALFFSVPINLNPLRLSFLECINKIDCKKSYVYSTLFFQIGSGALAYFYPKVKSAFGFLGGFLGLNMVVVVPCLIYIRTFGWNSRSAMITAVCTIMTVMGWLGAIFSQINQE